MVDHLKAALLVEELVSNSDTLTHHGVKGMKWGVRKDEYGPSQSLHRTKLEAKYLRKGMSQLEAETKAAGRIKTEKMLAGAVGVAVIGGAAYKANVEKGKYFTGVDLKKGSELKNVNPFGEKINTDRRLYATFLDKDTKKYEGMLAEAYRKNGRGTTKNRFGGNQEVFRTLLTTTEDIKAPSQHEAKKLYKEFKKANPNLAMADTYKQFNMDLVGEGIQANSKFYDFMKGKGYNAILDMNDQYVSGYNTSKPLIIFNAKSSLAIKGHEKVDPILSKAASSKQQKVAAFQVIGKAVVNQQSKNALGIGAVQSILRTRQTKAINKYFKEHPDSDLSPAEVYNMLYKTRKVSK